jgi:hypothetical protein
LLGEGNVNYNYSSSLKDDMYDTSKFTDIFTANNSRIRKFMNEDGTEGSAYPWWLRSAASGNSGSVGYVSGAGSVNNGLASDTYAVLPACLIG